jgi:DNA-binding transcriptional LysR family regulator
MRFERLDLNLLVALDALLTERSVTLAAERLCLSQSAASSSPARLRDYFGDELMAVRGRQMTLTVRGEELREPVRAVLEQIRNTITVAPEFNPLTCDRRSRSWARTMSRRSCWPTCCAISKHRHQHAGGHSPMMPRTR